MYNINHTWEPGMEMQYASVHPNIIYSGKKYIPLPRGEKMGFGNALFYLCPSQEATIAEIQSEYVRWFQNMYRLYTTDTYFKEKIGRKHIFVNMTQVIRRDWTKTDFPHPLKYVAPTQRAQRLKNSPNVIVDLGEWTNFYFEYSLKVSIPIIVKNYLKFLASKINAADWANYNKILYIPINQWFGPDKAADSLGFTKNLLNNPLAVIMFAAYKYPEMLDILPDMKIIIGDSVNDQFVSYDKSEFTKKNFPKIKMRLKMMRGFSWNDDSESILDVNFTPDEENEDSELNNQQSLQKYEDPQKVVPAIHPNTDDQTAGKRKLMSENRARLINDMKRNLVGDQGVDTGSTSIKENSTNGIGLTSGNADVKITDDTGDAPLDTGKDVSKRTQDMADAMGNKVKRTAQKIADLTTDRNIYDDEDSESEEDDVTPIHLDDEELDESIVEAVDDALLEIQEDDPDVLLNQNGDLTVDTIREKVDRRLKMNYMPEHTEKEMSHIRDLQKAQDLMFPKPQTAKQIKSKVVDTSDFSNALNIASDNIKKSKFVNFDKDYNEKKLESDIDSAVTALSHAAVKVFVTDKIVEDTSTQLDLKKTITYKLEDEWGNKHTIKVDIPIIVDDKYIWINGSKLLLGHQQIMMPIVKSNATDVQIVTWYNKLTLRREGVNDTRTSAIKRYLQQGGHEKFGVRLGNAMAKNADAKYPSTLDIDMYAKQFISFRIGHNVFILDRAQLLDKLATLYPNTKITDEPGMIPVGYNTDRKEVIYVSPTVSLSDYILKVLPDDAKAKITKNTRKSEQKLLRTNVMIMKQMVPLAVLLFFYEGFETVMKKAEINWYFITKDEDEVTHDSQKVDRSTHDIIELNDGYIVWERNPIWNTMFMNGLVALDLSIYDFEELEQQETYANILANYFQSKNITASLWQFYDFMLDPVTIEILEDYNLPTDFVELLLLGNRMLADNFYVMINNANAFRIRSNEIIAEYMYSAVVSAYKKFRQTQHKMGRNRKPDSINIKQNAVISGIARDSSLTNEASILNPILELEKARAVTPRGPRGVGKERAMTEPKRTYDPTMLGIMGMTTSPDAKVGITRQLTLEPNITSTRGYVKITEQEDLDNLNNANLLTPAELLSPPGALHDDGPRTSFGFKQSQYMLPVAGSTPVFFGNRVEEVVPYHMSREFVVTAKQDGRVAEIKDGIVVVEYKDGSHDSFDTNYKMKKNSSSGFYIRTQMETHLTEVGQTFKKNEVIAHDSRSFTKNDHDLSASMNIGVPIKVAIIPNFDIYEDAGPITEKLSEKFTAYMSMRTDAGIPAQSYVESMVDVGDRVEVGDPLIIYDPAHEDEETNAFLNEIRAKLGDDLSNLVDLKSMPQVRTEYAGRVAAIEVYSSVPNNELSPSLRKIVEKYTKHGKSVTKTLDKYKNEGDVNYFKCGQIISNSPEVVKPDYQNRVKGVDLGKDGRGVVIFFYIEFKDIAKTGDKGSAFTALKFTTSHVIKKGREAYSEYRPDEEISAIVAPGAILARKTPSIQETMFANKCIIEMKRHAMQIFFDDTEPNA